MEDSVYTLGDLPIIKLNKYLDNEKDALEECKVVVDCLHKYGILLVQDPRVSEEDNDIFIDQMERYFEQEDETKKSDIHPELHYQVGATPSFVEKARNHCERAKQYSEENKPATICPPELDTKWRFFWRIGDRPEPSSTKFPDLNAPQVIPKEFPDWSKVMNRWGGLMLETVKSVSEMTALGLGLPVNEFADKLKNAPHLLAPTGSDLKTWNAPNTMFANFHYDLNFMTIHGKSRFPGLYVWTREGKKIPVKMPAGCLLIQAGKQFEWLTGGHVLAGFHEVVVSEDTVTAVAKAKKENRSCWRVSSTLFSHIASDQVLQPLGRFDTAEARAKYPPTKTGKQVEEELAQIKLSRATGGANAAPTTH